MTKIPLTLLRRFESKSETRYAITKPRIIGDLLVATDGRKLIEVPASECHLESLEVLDIRDDQFPHYKPTLDECVPESGQFVELAIPTFPPMPEPQTCDECDGEGLVECYACHRQHPCDECDGTGKYRNISGWNFKTEIGFFNCDNFGPILDLPNVRIYASKTDKGFHCAYFTFGEKGRGCVMGMRSSD